MSDQDLDKIFQQTEIPPPSAGAKRRAMNMAVAEFEEVQNEAQKSSSFFQGFLSSLRLIGKSNDSDRRKDMNKKTLPWVYGSVVGVSMALFAGLMVIRMPSDFNTSDHVEVPLELVEEYEVAEGERLIEEVVVVDAELAKKQQHAKIVKSERVSNIETRPSDLMDTYAEQESVDISVAESSADDSVKSHLDGSSVNDPGDSVLIAPEPQIASAPLKKDVGKSRTILKEQVAALPAIASVPNYHLQSKKNAAFSRLETSRPSHDASLSQHIISDNRERFNAESINSVKRVTDEPVSTFSVDVDTASYAFSRKKLNQGMLPNPDAVRIEEFINYFDYQYPASRDRKTPFATHVLVGDSPWKPGNKLLHIGIKGFEVQQQPKSNLVFLLDVSGSMSSVDKLPLVKQSIQLLLTKLLPQDTVSIVVYAGAAGTVLEPTKVKDKNTILNALNRLQAGGSTAGGQGIELAYRLAEQNFDKDAVNRIVLATDGDFNVGISDPEKLKKLVEKKRESGVFLSVLGFGQGNYHDALMQTLAQNGNGVAAYIDTLSEAQKVLVEESTSSLFTIAKDVKIQIDFNPDTVSEYRLIGYETRHLAREDFNNDKVDAGDIGAGHTVTAIYEITPVGADSALVDASRYVKKSSEKNKRDEYAFLKLRYKLPDENKSTLVTQIIPRKNTVIRESSAHWGSEAFDFSSAVAGFAQLLKDDRYMNGWTYDDVIKLALSSRGEDVYGYRNEFVQLVRKAKLVSEL